MSIKVLKCARCAGLIDFGGKATVRCKICGFTNEHATSEEAIKAAAAKLEETLGIKIKDLEQRFKSKGADVEARDYIFRKDFKPRIDVVFDNLTERFDDSFRRPIFQINLLAKYSHMHNVDDLFKIGRFQRYTDGFTKDLNEFAEGQLALPVMKLLAASQQSQDHIDLLRMHTMFISRLYNIRGIALDLNPESIQAVGNLMSVAIEECKELEKLYLEVPNGKITSIKFGAWAYRLTLNSNINKILALCIGGKYSQVLESIDKVIADSDKLIQFYKDKSEQEKDKYPLFLVMIITEGFNIDKMILKFLSKFVDVTREFKKDFLTQLSEFESLLNIADILFNKVELDSTEWDNNWIKNLEEPFERFFEILNNLIAFSKISLGRKPVFVLEIENELFDAWEKSDTVVGSQLSKKYYNLTNVYNIRNRIILYIPMAVMNVYAILKTGFIRKGGDEFESFLMVNPFFRNDAFIDRYGYPRAFGYIDIAETLKEKDPLKNQLLTLENIVEKGGRKVLGTLRTILPVLVTQKEIEEFVQKTYDIFEIVKDTEDPIPDFKKNYKKVGIAKKVEKLSGELIDYIYIPALLLELEEGFQRKGEFVRKEDFKWKLLLPFNNSPSDPWNKFINMNVNPYSIKNVVDEIQKFK